MAAHSQARFQPRGKLRYDEPMSRHTSWRVGGPADLYFQPADLRDLVDFLRQRPEKDWPLTWIGLGSNTLVRDAGIRGIVVAGLLSALMSSLAGVFNASSTLVTIDLYKKWFPEAPEKRLVQVGRYATLAAVLIGLLWIPVIKNADKGLYDFLQSVQGYLAPPIFVVFFLGVFWSRANGPGCLASLLVGFAVGLFRLAVDTAPKVAGEGFAYAEGGFLWITSKIYFQYFSLLITVISAAVLVIVSLATKTPDRDQISGLTYGSLTDEQKANSRASWGTTDVVTSCIVMALIIGAYIYFSG